MHRRSTPKVKNGQVRRKNRTDESPSIWNHEARWPQIIREKPGQGYRHVVRIPDVQKFLGILPDWDEMSISLNTVLLATGESGCMGWHSYGIVAINAWDRDDEKGWDKGFLLDHSEILDRLDVDYDPGSGKCHFNDVQAKSFLLMHVLLHELGHHHDRMTTSSQIYSSRGESYAENYAIRYAEEIWDSYFKEFGW